MASERQPVNVAILGATGRVGQELIKILEERKFPVNEFRALASQRSKDARVSFNGREYVVQAADEESFKGIDIVLASAGAEISRQLTPLAVRQGACVIDNSNAFRMDAAVPLVVPEVNAQALQQHRGIVANPNCSTSQLVIVLKPLHDAAGLKRVIVSTYQSVSGAGKEAMDELERQTRALGQGKEYKPEVFPQQIAYNLIPHIDKFLDNGYTKEEMKVVQETQKILGLPDLPVTCTAVRVPVFISHSESVLIETEKLLSPQDARAILAKAAGVEVADDPKNGVYPTPLACAGQDPVYVGRIRRDTSSPNGLNLWVVADNLRIGAALNAVRIAEYLYEHKLLHRTVSA
jgi:aspartate-semialdehyde dehydrogenase